MLKLQGHYASFDKFYYLNVWIVLASLYSKVTALLALPCIFLRNFKIFTRFLRILNNSIMLAWHRLYLDFILAIYTLYIRNETLGSHVITQRLAYCPQ